MTDGSFAAMWDLARVRHVETAKEKGRAFAVGERIGSEVMIEDSEGRRIPLLETTAPDTKVIVLFVFGGGAVSGGRAGIWCEDSLDELPLFRHFDARSRRA